MHKQLSTFFAILGIAFSQLAMDVAHAQSPEQKPKGLYVLSERMLKKIRRGPERFVPNTVRTLYQYGVNGALTRDLIQLQIARLEARSWSTAIGQLLGYDLNRDLVIDAKEIGQLPQLLPTQDRAKFDIFITMADQNKDGEISWAEINQHANAQIKQAGTRTGERLAELMSLDFNQDGTLNTADIAQVVAAVIKRDAVMNRQPDTPAGKARVKYACIVPKPSKNAMVILLNGHEGKAISTVAVSGQASKTSVVTLEIATGDTPIFLVAYTNNAIIWQITGATDRIEHIHIGLESRGAGVTGVVKDKVSFGAIANCLPKLITRSHGAAPLAAKARLMQILGKPVDIIVAAYTLRYIKLPSGEQDSRQKQPNTLSFNTIPHQKPTVITKTFMRDGQKITSRETTTGDTLSPRDQAIFRLETSLAHTKSGGVIEIDPATVVASGKAVAYDILPGAAGLLQLFYNNSLASVNHGHFLIQKTFPRFPPDLTRVHSLRFILGKGIALPAGKPGHGSVVSEETGECLFPRRGRCR